MSVLISNELNYPNGTPYLQLLVYGHVIGTATKVEGGYLANGRRKPVQTLDEAAKQLLDSRISQHHNDIQKLRGMLSAVLNK